MNSKENLKRKVPNQMAKSKAQIRQTNRQQHVSTRTDILNVKNKTVFSSNNHFSFLFENSWNNKGVYMIERRLDFHIGNI